MAKIRSFDFLGNIAVVKFPEDFKLKDKKKFALGLMESNKSIKTVVEKQGRIKGRLRKFLAKHIAGEKSKEVLYKENNCVFRFNIDTTYFSPRLSNERKEISEKIKKNDCILVMFAGVAPFSVVIAKNSGAQVYSNEINQIANKYARLNAELNKVKDKIKFLDGDIKKIAPKLNRKFDVIVMPRPKLKETFLKQTFMLSKKGTKVYYYDFCKLDEVDSVVNKIKKEAKENKKRIKIMNTKRAGEIAPYKIRIRVDFKILNQ